MIKKLSILIGAAAIMVSLLIPVTKSVPDTTKHWVEGWGNGELKPQMKTVTDYKATTNRTIAITVGAIALVLVLPKSKLKD